MVEERDREEEKRNTPNIVLPSPKIIKNWVFFKLSQDLFPQREEKTTFSLFSWLEAGANPADIYTRAQPYMRTG